LGEGEVYFEGKKSAFECCFKQFDWQPIVLQSKEGLALLNGTQFMSAYGAHILMK
jgi:histidine ammonia-lyase